jgi:hypothetical protein
LKIFPLDSWQLSSRSALVHTQYAFECDQNSLRPSISLFLETHIPESVLLDNEPSDHLWESFSSTSYTKQYDRLNASPYENPFLHQRSYAPMYRFFLTLKFYHKWQGFRA